MKYLSNKEKKHLYRLLYEVYGIKSRILNALKKGNAYIMDNIVFVDDIPISIKYNDKTFLPTLILLVDSEDFNIPYVIVDRGAVSYILNGADIFRPGIIEADKNLRRSFPVIIVSEDKKLLAVGISLVNYGDFSGMKKGKVIRNIHWYGDKIFNLYKSKK